MLLLQSIASPTTKPAPALLHSAPSPRNGRTLQKSATWPLIWWFLNTFSLGKTYGGPWAYQSESGEEMLLILLLWSTKRDAEGRQKKCCSVSSRERGNTQSEQLTLLQGTLKLGTMVDFTLCPFLNTIKSKKFQRKSRLGGNARAVWESGLRAPLILVWILKN